MRLRILSLFSLSVVASMAACSKDEAPGATVAGFVCDQPMASPIVQDSPTDSPYTIDDAAWDETAVRQVLHVFAFGGFASDAQIKTWADMKPGDAIKEIISLDTVNDKVSPSDGLSPGIKREHGSLRCLSQLFALDDPQNPIKASERSGYKLSEWDSPSKTWFQAVRTRGLNPVRQRIGLLETNYHLSVSHNAGITNLQMISYYDKILASLAQGDTYQNTLALASLSAAVAQQYNHKNNVYKDGKFSGNEDFAREYHQLFFGILGKYDDKYTGEKANWHELVTIPNTAKALTDLTVGTNERSDVVTYGTNLHWQGPLEILEQTITGENAKDRIQSLAQISIQHPESLENLPIILVRQLADDQLDPNGTAPEMQERVKIIRELWSGMQNKNLLEFLRKYAISKAFHSANRVKFWTSLERNLLITNLLNSGNLESYRDMYSTKYFVSLEDFNVFRPAHDVFGGQTGIEAAKTPDVFQNAYNHSVRDAYTYTRVEELDNAKNQVWKKELAPLVPKGDDGKFRVKQVAEWLWERFIADKLQNFGALERAHVYAILASGKDLAYWFDANNPTATYTEDDLANNRNLKDQVAGAELALIKLDDADGKVRLDANYRVTLAINFIVATPYMFLQKGR